VLPAQLPLLLNGSSGIAVGMATNIPPHNFGEVVDGLINFNCPELPDEELFELIPGPDFPTEGKLSEQLGLAYTTGRGSISGEELPRLRKSNLGVGAFVGWR